MDEPVQTVQMSGPEALPLTRSIPSPVSSTKNIGEDQERPGKRPRLEGLPPMTAAAAVADAKQRSKSPSSIDPPTTKTSVNPATEALSALMGVSQNAVSNAYTAAIKSDPTDTVNSTSPGTAVTAEQSQAQSQAQAQAQAQAQTDEANITIAPVDPQNQTSPTSTTSYDGQASVTATSGAGTTVASPQPMDTQPTTASSAADESTVGEGSKAFSYPAPLLQPQLNDERLQPRVNDDKRGMSLPHSGLAQNARSPSKKHQCPYCNTEFTRHHNLKSHLLTHSQEKPYVCSTCQSRFRRLHDLKRHTKLHTGERPHVCPKCKRKFARGDALARHNKGPGGCAGRRASMGSFGGDDDMDGAEEMEGIMYGEPEEIEEIEENAVKGTPGIRRQAPSGDDTMDDSEYSRIPSTYPPIQGRPPGGIASGQFPPRPSYGPAAATATPGPSGSNSTHVPAIYPASGPGNNLRPSNSVFAQNPLTESPKAISPRQPQRMPTDGRMPSPNMPPFQPPSFNGNRSMSVSGSSSGPQLPPPHALNPPDSRYTLASQGTPTHPPTQPSGPPTHMSGSGPLSSHSNSLSSHGQSGPGSGDHANAMFNKEDRLWAVVKDLEMRVSSMQEEINSLKTQLAAATASQPVRT